MLKRVCGGIIGALTGVALALLPGLVLALAFILVFRDPDWAFDGLAPIACLLLSFLVGAALGARAGWRYVQQQEREHGSRPLPSVRPDERAWPPPPDGG